MSNRTSRIDRARDRDNASLSAPDVPFGVWQPFWAAALGCNAQAHESRVRIASQWQEFVGRRLTEDFTLMQRLARCATPHQVMAAYADFWRQAADDYGNEIVAMSKLMSGAANGMAESAQAAPRERDAEVYRTGRAA
jgi:hypothetical protein